MELFRHIDNRLTNLRTYRAIPLVAIATEKEFKLFKTVNLLGTRIKINSNRVRIHFWDNFICMYVENFITVFVRL